MKTFIAGESVKAVDLNANFDEATEFIAGSNSNFRAKYTDDITNIGGRSSTFSIYITVKSFDIGTTIKVLNGVLQQVSASTILATASVQSTMCYGGFIYALLYVGSTYSIYRCSLSNNIAVAGNWAQVTVSGFSLSSSCYFAGYGDNKFWLTNGTGYVSLTLSGTTLNYNSTVTVTGANPSSEKDVVNDNGIYAYFSSDPKIRKASFAGVLDNSKQFYVPYSIFATNKNAYRSITSTGSIMGMLKFD